MRRLVDASVSNNTRRAYAGALGQLDAWLAGQKLDDAALAAYLVQHLTSSRPEFYQLHTNRIVFCSHLGPLHRALESLPIIPVIVKDSLARIAPTDTAIGRPSAIAPPLRRQRAAWCRSRRR